MCNNRLPMNARPQTDCALWGFDRVPTWRCQSEQSYLSPLHSKQARNDTCIKKKKRTEEKKRTNPFGVVDPARAFIPFVILSDEKLPEIRAYTRKRWFWNLFYKLLFYFCTRVSANRDLPNRGGSTVRFSEPNSANVGKTRNGEFDSWYA